MAGGSRGIRGEISEIVMAIRTCMITTACALHTTLITVWVFVATVLLGSAAIAVSLFSHTGDSVHLVARLWGRTILWVSGVRVEIHGLANRPSDRACIYMANHQGNFDIPVLLGRLPVQFRWLAKAELFKIPIFGRSMRSAGYIGIDRSNREAAFASLDQAAETIRAGTSIMIFPEGTRSRDGALLPFKKGGFVMAVEAGVPVVPIAITGTHAIMPKGRWMIRRGDVRVRLMPSIDTAVYSRETKDDLMARVRAAILRGLNENQAERSPCSN